MDFSLSAAAQDASNRRAIARQELRRERPYTG
jgi:hypothetical protein